MIPAVTACQDTAHSCSQNRQNHAGAASIECALGSGNGRQSVTRHGQTLTGLTGKTGGTWYLRFEHGGEQRAPAKFEPSPDGSLGVDIYALVAWGNLEEFRLE